MLNVMKIRLVSGKYFILLLTVFLLLFSSTNAQSYYWVVINPSSIPGTPYFSDAYFTGDNTGWVTSSTVTVENIFKTDDGASSFSTQVTNLGINAIYMIDANTGFSGGASGFVYNTLNGGLNWAFLGTMETTLNDIDFATTTPPNTLGYACGDSGAVFSITLGWVNNLNSGQAVNFTGISSTSVDSVWVCGGNTIMFYNMVSFTFQSGPVGSYNAIYFINNQKGWVVGNSGLIGHTTNGGNTWTSQINLDSNSLNDLFFLNIHEGWAVGVNGTILHTTNGGNTWNLEGTGLTTAFLTGVHFTSSTNGYVVGNNKTLLKYTQSTGIKPISGILPENYSLIQNYPNPFNPTTNIRFNLPRASYIKLTIYDILGSEVAVLVNEKLKSGSYEVNWDGSAYTSGVYFYKLTTNEFSDVKKMILIK